MNIRFYILYALLFGFGVLGARKAKIAFFINLLSVRGTEVAVYDYADCNETVLGNESIIINNTEYFDKPEYNHWLSDYTDSVREKFVNRFGSRIFNCANMQEIERALQQEQVDIFYALKYGVPDDKISKVCKNAVHAVFAVQKHGDAYATISPWVSRVYGGNQVPFVPHMVRVDATTENLRQELGIPVDSVVFGRHGGVTTFNIPFAKEAVQEVALQHKDWYFVFLNTGKFCDMPNVIFLPATGDMKYKTKFINSCDAMIHARQDGETFGLACAEFSIKNKPVITWLGSHDRCHVEILGSKGFYYNNKQELLERLLYCGNNVQALRVGNWDCYSTDYSPEVVMKKFDEVFIQPLLY